MPATGLVGQRAFFTFRMADEDSHSTDSRSEVKNFYKITTYIDA